MITEPLRTVPPPNKQGGVIPHFSEQVGAFWMFLRSFRILDMSDACGLLAGHVLAKLGADVILLEPPEGYAKRSAEICGALFFTAYIIGGIMAFGALFSALNTMYSAVSARRREIAVLRAIGFGAAPIVGSVIIEARLLAILGGVLGASFVSALLNQGTMSMLGGNDVQIVFRLPFTMDLALLGIGAGAAVGILGSVFPALWAATLPIATALRKT